MHEYLCKLELNPPAAKEDIEACQNALNRRFPECFSAFLAHANGGEGDVGENGYAMLWSAGELPELNTAYQVSEFVDDVVLIGSDGSGEAFGLDYASGSAVYIRLPFVGMSREVIVHMGNSFDDFIESLAVT